MSISRRDVLKSIVAVPAVAVAVSCAERARLATTTTVPKTEEKKLVRGKHKVRFRKTFRQDYGEYHMKAEWFGEKNGRVDTYYFVNLGGDEHGFLKCCKHQIERTRENGSRYIGCDELNETNESYVVEV